MLNLTAPQKNVMNMAATKLWQYFSDYIRIVSSSEELIGEGQTARDAFIEYVTNDLNDKGFTEDEITRIMDIYNSNTLGYDVANKIDMNLAYKIISYTLQLENEEYTQAQVIDIIHNFNLDFSSKEGMDVYTAYHKYSFA